MTFAEGAGLTVTFYVPKTDSCRGEAHRHMLDEMRTLDFINKRFNEVVNLASLPISERPTADKTT